MLILKMAWRSIWRNRTRTAITAAGILIGVMMMIFAHGFSIGFAQKMVRVATQVRSGDARIVSTQWAETQSETEVMDRLSERLEALDSAAGIAKASPRVLGFGLLSIGSRSQGVELLGVDPARESSVTNWGTRLVSGVYPTKSGEALIGAKLAEELEIELGARVVVTGANVHTGEAATELVRVVGLLNTGDNSIDEGSAIVHIEQAQRILGLPDSAHVIAIDVEADVLDDIALTSALEPLKAEGIEVQDWKRINPMIAQVHELMGAYMGIVLVFIFLIISFSIVNTISMSLLERFHEFGVMRAIGTTPLQLAAQIVAEAGFLGLVGAIPGMLAGVGLNAYYAEEGMNFSEMNAYGMTFVDPIYTTVDVPYAVQVALTFAVLTALASLLTAFRAARLKPVEAMRR